MFEPLVGEAMKMHRLLLPLTMLSIECGPTDAVVGDSGNPHIGDAGFYGDSPHAPPDGPVISDSEEVATRSACSIVCAELTAFATTRASRS